MVPQTWSYCQDMKWVYYVGSVGIVGQAFLIVVIGKNILTQRRKDEKYKENYDN